MNAYAMLFFLIHKLDTHSFLRDLWVPVIWWEESVRRSGPSELCFPPLTSPVEENGGTLSFLNVKFDTQHKDLKKNGIFLSQ